MMNRIEAPVDVLGIRLDNLLPADSGVSDVDVARETAEMPHSRVLARASILILAEANRVP
jgi:flagellin-like hook-associated protein FlgL